MSYYYTRVLRNVSFDEAIAKVTEELKKEGFGIITEIDVSATFKNKLNVNFRPYRILGTCNPPFAYRALQTEDKIGTMLPCNVVLQETENATIEVTAVDPVKSIMAAENQALTEIAGEVREKLNRVIEGLE